MSDTYTCSVWEVPGGRESEFPAAFAAWAAAADELGALDGVILQDETDPTRFIVVRRWESREALDRWAQASTERPGPAGEALRGIVGGAVQAYATRKVGDLGRRG